MNNENLGLDVGQANELKLAFRRFDWDNSHIKRLCEGDVLGNALDILRGDSVAVPVERAVDLNALPNLDGGVTAIKHLKQGKKLWRNIRLAVFDPRDLDYTVDCHPDQNWNRNRKQLSQLWKCAQLNRQTLTPRYLRGQRPANICLRDFFLKNPHLVPRSILSNYSSAPLLFWGTICTGDEGDYSYFVPGMRFDYGKWMKYDRRIEGPGQFAFEHHDAEQYENPCVVFAPAMPN